MLVRFVIAAILLMIMIPVGAVTRFFSYEDIGERLHLDGKTL